MEYADILSREYTQEHKVHMQIKLPLSLLFNFASVSFGVIQCQVRGLWF